MKSKMVGIVCSLFPIFPGAIAGLLVRGDMMPVVMVAVLTDLVLRFGKQPIGQMARAVRKSTENR